MGLKTFNEPLLARHGSASDKIQKGSEIKGRKNVHQSNFINAFGAQEVDDKTIGAEMLFRNI